MEKYLKKILRKLRQRNSVNILVVGESGVGKTSEMTRSERPSRIATLTDAVEIPFTVAALRSAMRETPSYVYLGELRGGR
ncbi:hypothetical protein ACIPLR_17880 [Herbaspirillum huttiense]|uniref:hypothetical protein n=1 Tax=Herbaspirillum huttiense TaxID=863372 RepID=UPI00381AA67E